jgi:hypothetical protein
MANTAVSALTAASAIDSDDVMYIVEDGNSRKVTLAQLAAFLSTNNDSFDIEHPDTLGQFGSPSTVGNALQELYALAASSSAPNSFQVEHSDPSGRFGSPSTVGNALEELASAKMFEWSGMIEGPEHNKTYTLCLKVPFAGTIHETTTDCGQGSGSARFKIEGVNLGGTINTVSTSEQSQTHNSANVFASGNTISFTVTMDSPSIIDFVFTVRYSRFL